MPRAPLKRRPAGAEAPGARRVWLAPIAAALLAAVVYANALHNPFVYDDRDTVTANPSIVDLSNVRFLLAYSPFRPVVNISYGIDHQMWGPTPAGYHATNIALHAAVVVLLFYLIAGLLADAGFTENVRAGAFAGAALFAVHPLQTEAVGYVSGRSEVLCACWFLASCLAARRAMRERSGWQVTAAAGFGLLALASKEIAVVLPIVLVGYDALLGPGGSEGRRWRLTRLFIPAALVLVAAALVRLLAFGAVAGLPPVRAALLNLLTQAAVIWRYAGLLIWPQGQSIMHGVHRAAGLADPLGLAALAGIAALCAAAFRMRRTAPLAAFGLLWFLAVLAPSSSVIPLREGMAEHRAYLASAGLFIIAADLVARWRAPGGMPGDARRAIGRPGGLAAGAAAVLILVVLLGGLTIRRNRVWASPVALWSEATVHAAGMWEPSYALGDALREAGDCHRAIDAYRRVVALRPGHRDAQTNLGICLAQIGQLDEAEQAFRTALAIDPAFARGYTNLGALALIRGDPEEARRSYMQAIALDRANVLARLQLASLFEHSFRDYHAAARMCGEARLLAPATPGVAECVARNQKLAADRDAGR